MNMFTTGACGRKRRRYCSTLSVILGLLSAVGPLAMPAAAEVSLRVSPVVIELEAKPGATGSHGLTASNEGDQPVLITAAIEPYKTASDVDRSAVDWLTVEPGSFELGPAEEQTVNVSIAVPDDVPAGGRYALVTFTTGAPETATDEGGSGIGVAGSLGAVFLFAIDGEGELNRHASLERFAPILEPDGRIGFRAEVLNDGNLYLQATGAVLVTNGADEAAGSLEFPPTTAQLQGETNVLSSFGSLPLQPDEPYRAEALLDYNGAEPMTATLEFTPAIALAVTGTALCENLDRGPTLTVNLRNDGTLGLLPPVQADITDANDQPIATGEPGIPALIWPGETGVVTVDFPDRLLSGDYATALRIDYAAPVADGQTLLPPLEKEIGFAIGGLGDTAIPLCATE